MTTAHRPTWVSAMGGVKNHGFSSKHISAKDQNGETQLKYRQVGQGAKSEMQRRDLVDELEKREFEHLSEKNKLIAMIENEEKKVDAIPLLKERAEAVTHAVSAKYNDADIDTNGQDDDDDDDDDEFDSSRYILIGELLFLMMRMVTSCCEMNTNCLTYCVCFLSVTRMTMMMTMSKSL
jgi:hypothetical protein